MLQSCSGRAPSFAPSDRGYTVQETEHDELIRCTSPRGNSVSLLNVACSFLHDEPFDDLDSVTSSGADTVESVSLARTCEMQSIEQAPSPPDAVPDPASVTRVFARRKPARGEDVRGTDTTLLLNLENLTPLFHLPLVEAAERLGLCRTALKNVCRKFSVARWPFRGRGRREKTASPSSPRDGTPSNGLSAAKSHQEVSSAVSRSPGHSGVFAAPVPAAAMQHSRKREAPADRPQRSARSEARPLTSRQEELPRGFQFSSADAYPGEARDGFALAYGRLAAAAQPNAWLAAAARPGVWLAVAAQPGVSAVPDGWRLPASAPRVESEAGSAGSFASEGGDCSDLEDYAEDVGCDLSFLYAGLEAVHCTRV
ncbi:hypothetical protein T484DRAFT_1881846 [Baffinella frigidus]|nr:hypothetical protein T484DRAFT_1881846 [Cryptophyta sp. CCMP2293]